MEKFFISIKSKGWNISFQYSRIYWWFYCWNLRDVLQRKKIKNHLPVFISTCECAYKIQNFIFSIKRFISLNRDSCYKVYKRILRFFFNQFLILKPYIMAKGINLKPAKTDLKAKKQEKILKKLEDKQKRKRK